MMYIGIYTAIYDYEAQNEQELSFKTNDIFYILDNSDSDWYKAQLKTTEVKIGLIPSNYIEKAKSIGSLKTLYAYEAQAEEEISFKENEILTLYNSNDSNWYVVENSKGETGLVPSNYVEQQTTSSTKKNKAPEPIKKDIALSWHVHEYDMKKKKKSKSKGSLMIGNGLFCFGSETDKSSPVRQFLISQVIDAKMDGKTIHIQLNNQTFLHFYSASHSEARAIIAKISESKNILNESKSQEQQQSPLPPPPPPPPKQQQLPVYEPRWAIALYAFSPEADGETQLEENEQVLVTYYAENIDWWTIEHKDGTTGIVPSNYVKFQDEYEADLKKEEEEEAEKKKLEEEKQKKLDEENKKRLEEEEQRKLEDEQKKLEEEQKRAEENKKKDEEDKQRKEEEKKQRELEEKEKELQAEIERRKKLQENTNSQTSIRRSQIPAPPPPVQVPPIVTKNDSYQSSQSQEEQNQQHDPNKLNPDKIRTWKDSTGVFNVDAQFMTYVNGKIRLHKTNGVKIDVPAEKMCEEDLRYVEQETGIKLVQLVDNDDDDEIPLAHLRTKNFKWVDFFKKANLPEIACINYATSFEANKLTQEDIEKLTHRQMKKLGMTENHVQRVQRYIETNQPEPLSEDEIKPSQVERKKSVSFGDVSYIEDTPYDDVQNQMDQDELLTRKLQEEENSNSSNKSGLQRRGTGRPTPTNPAPQNVDSSILTSQQFKEHPISPPPLPKKDTIASLQPISSFMASNGTPLTSEFENGPWTPSPLSSPQQTTPCNTSPTSIQGTTSPNSIDPQLLAKWGGDQSLATANLRPVPAPPTNKINQYNAPLQKQQSFSTPLSSPNSIDFNSGVPYKASPTSFQEAYMNQALPYGPPPNMSQPGRNWTNATPENPFGINTSPPIMQQQSPPIQQQQPFHFLPQHNMGYVSPYNNSYPTSPIDPNNRYPAFNAGSSNNNVYSSGQN